MSVYVHAREIRRTFAISETVFMVHSSLILLDAISFLGTCRGRDEKAFLGL